MRVSVGRRGTTFRPSLVSRRRGRKRGKMEGLRRRREWGIRRRRRRMPRWANGTLTFPPPHHRHFILPVCVRCQRVWSELVLLSLPFLDCVNLTSFFFGIFRLRGSTSLARRTDSNFPFRLASGSPPDFLFFLGYISPTSVNWKSSRWPVSFSMNRAT